MASGRERRQEKRFRVKDCLLKARKGGLLAFLRRPGGEALPVTNLSLGGLEFVSRESLPAGQPLRIFLDAPAFTQALKFMADVRWSRAVPLKKVYRIGVQFRKITAEQRKQLTGLKHDPLMRGLKRARETLL